jgi:hypothetical protein
MWVRRPAGRQAFARRCQRSRNTLGRRNDDAPQRIEWNYQPRYVWPMDIPALSDEELLGLFERQPLTDSGSSPQAEALAA